MANGYTGRILHVDLTSGKLEIENPPESFYRKYIGGSAMGVYYILQKINGKIDPLGPENVMTMMVSVLTGAPISGQSRMTTNAISPLVDGIGDSQSGGFFPAELKFSGFDGVVFTGRAPEPVYLWIKDGQAELRPAGHLWGKTTEEAEDILKEELGDPKVEIAQIGPAGEKLVRLAAIINMANRANGRTGMGAVMGSKNLKAVAVRGSSKRLPVADAKGLNALARQGAQNVPTSCGGLNINGTAGSVAPQHLNGGLPTYNFNAGQFEQYESISGELMTETMLVDRDTCYACSVRCKRVVETEWQGHAVKGRQGGAEYETIATFGSYCGVSDLHAVSYANALCNLYGMDTIGVGATIAWAMECFENGLLTEKEIGFPAPFGDAQAMTRLTEMIARREGFGDVLANGSRKAADLLDRGHEYLITVKGAEAPAHMPQVKRSLGLIYAVNPFGADHESSEHDPSIANEEGSEMKRMRYLGLTKAVPVQVLNPDKVRFAFKTQQYFSFLDSASLCTFVWGPGWSLYGPPDALEMIKAITGWEDYSIEELLQVGERRINMMRALNARLGIGRAADQLPKKFFKPLTGSGPSAGIALSHEELEEAKDEYYRQAGWEVMTGNPKAETLARLGLDWAL